MFIFFQRSELLRGVVGLDGFGLDDDGSVAFLPCFRAGCDRAGDVAGRESQRNGKDSERHQEDGGDGGSDSIRHNRRCFFHRRVPFLSEFGVLLGKDEAVEGLVLGLGFELRFVGGTGGGIRQGCLGGGSRLTELVLACQFGFREGFGTRIADLRSEVGLAHFLEDDLGVFADFATEGGEWYFQIVL